MSFQLRCNFEVRVSDFFYYKYTIRMQSRRRFFLFIFSRSRFSTKSNSFSTVLFLYTSIDVVVEIHSKHFKLPKTDLFSSTGNLREASDDGTHLNVISFVSLLLLLFKRTTCACVCFFFNIEIKSRVWSTVLAIATLPIPFHSVSGAHNQKEKRARNRGWVRVKKKTHGNGPFEKAYEDINCY